MNRHWLGSGWRIYSVILFGLVFNIARGQQVSVAKFGVRPNSGKDSTPGVLRAIASAKGKDGVNLTFPKGRYDFWPEHAALRHYFISNHDAVEERAVAMPLEEVQQFTLDGQGSTFVFHGPMLPISVVNSANVTLRNFSIDDATQHILETKVLRSSAESVDLQVLRGEYAIEHNQIVGIADGWRHSLGTSQEFDAASRAIAWNAHADLEFDKTNAVEIAPHTIRIKGMPIAPSIGNIVVLWDRDRPDPAIWTSESKTILVSNVDVHSALGMGYLGQKSEDVHLDGFRVTLAATSPRYVTTTADAVHFSSCRGKILVENGVFENMLDDGINVHGTYLRIAAKPSAHSLLLEWTHSQTFGFRFAAPGEHIDFVSPQTLLPYASNVVRSASMPDEHHVLLEFEQEVDSKVRTGDAVDNIDWQPSVIYRNNVVRHNRSRGVIFKTPRGVLIEGNTFDHLSGTAVLMIADARSWFESMPASHVFITQNHFIDQVSTYGAAPIVISPVVDTNAEPMSYNVHDIRIENNTFEVFQHPLLRAVSVEGLIFRNNLVHENHDYPAFVRAGSPVYSFVHTHCVDVGSNQLPWQLAAQDIQQTDSKNIHMPANLSNTNDWAKQCAAVLVMPAPTITPK